MALIKCPECGREVADKAPACPGCGVPIAADSRAAGAALTTTQGTSKRIKLLEAVGATMAAFGIAISFVLIGDESQQVGAFWPIMGVLGFVLYIYARIKRWWHHS